MKEESSNGCLFVVIALIFLIPIIGVPIIFIRGFTNIIKDDFKERSRKKYKLRNLLILATALIKSNRQIVTSQLDYVRTYFKEYYGEKAAVLAFEQFKKINQDQFEIEEICENLCHVMAYGERFDFVEFLFSLAYSTDGVDTHEEDQIIEIASYFYLSKEDYQYLRAAFFQQEIKDEVASNYFNSLAQEFKILQLSENATNDEVKKAYRKLVKKYHPDRLHNASIQDVAIAKEKFQKIQRAYEVVKTNRNFYF